jgi:hypothetical protein
LSKREDFGIVNIVKESTPFVTDYERLSKPIIPDYERPSKPIVKDHERPSKPIPPVMDTIVQQTFVSPSKLDLKKLDEDVQPQPQQTITATEQLAEQTAHTFDDIRK